MQVPFDANMKRVVRDYMRVAAEDAIQQGAKLAYETLRTNIMRYTYRYDYFPNKRYEGGTRIPSFEFLNSFILKKLRSSSVWISQELFHDWNQMTSDSTTFRHYGSSRFGDSRKNIADILNTTGVANWGRSDYKKRLPFWTKTMEELEIKLRDLFDKVLGSYGFERTK